MIWWHSDISLKLVSFLSMSLQTSPFLTTFHRTQVVVHIDLKTTTSVVIFKILSGHPHDIMRYYDTITQIFLLILSTANAIFYIYLYFRRFCHIDWRCLQLLLISTFYYVIHMLWNNLQDISLNLTSYFCIS